MGEIAPPGPCFPMRSNSSWQALWPSWFKRFCLCNSYLNHRVLRVHRVLRIPAVDALVPNVFEADQAKLSRRFCPKQFRLARPGGLDAKPVSVSSKLRVSTDNRGMLECPTAWTDPKIEPTQIAVAR